MPGSIRVKLPPKFNTSAFRKEFKKAVKEFALLPKADFEKVVRYWTGERPKFVPEVKEGDTYIRLTIRVMGGKGKDKFNWLDYGTRPHIIRPKSKFLGIGRKKTLAFHSGKYKAGSKPGTTTVSKGKPAKGPMVFPEEVHHPGFPARGWRELISKRNEPHLHGLLQRAMRTAAKASGHGVK